jgi:hypothetical protein
VKGLDHAGSTGGWETDALRRAVLPELRATADAGAARLYELQREEKKLAGQMLAEWDRAAAAAVFAGAGPLATVHRAEGHTCRELHRAPALFDLLQARRQESAGAARPGVAGFRLVGGVPTRSPLDVGFVLPTGMSGDRPRVVTGLGV